MADRLITNFWFHRKNSNKCFPKDQKSRKINLTKKNISIIIFGKIFKNCREIIGLCPITTMIFLVKFWEILKWIFLEPKNLIWLTEPSVTDDVNHLYILHM